MGKNFLWKIQRKMRRFLAGIKISWGVVVGFGTGIVLCALVSYTALYFYSRQRFNSISEAFAHLLSLEIEVPDYSEEFGEEYSIEIGEKKKDIFGDYIVPYTLSDRLYEKCKFGFCKVIPEVRLEGEESYQIAGPSTLLEGEFEKEGDLQVLAVVVGEDIDSANLQVAVRIFNENGIIVGEVVEESLR